MTLVILLEELQKRLEEELKDMVLPVKSKRGEEKSRPLKVYKMNLPNKEEQMKQVPYILLKVVTGKDEQSQGGYIKNTCNIRFIIVIYDDDAGSGEMALLNIISKIRFSLLENPILSRQFEALKPIEYFIYQEDTKPYYLGEIMTTWSLPEVHRKL